MSYVLDTTAVSDLVRAEPRTAARLATTRPDEVSIPQPVLAELRYGLARLARSRRRTELERRIATILRSIQRCAWNDEVSAQFGVLKASLERAGDRLDDFDLMIAAHALAHDAILVTSNTRHFERISGLEIEDWAAPPR